MCQLHPTDKGDLLQNELIKKMTDDEFVIRDRIIDLLTDLPDVNMDDCLTDYWLSADKGTNSFIATFPLVIIKKLHPENNPSRRSFAAINAFGSIFGIDITFSKLPHVVQNAVLCHEIVHAFRIVTKTNLPSGEDDAVRRTCHQLGYSDRYITIFENMILPENLEAITDPITLAALHADYERILSAYAPLTGRSNDT